MGADEPLSSLDATFFAIERGATHMHVGAVGIFEAGPLTTKDGGIDLDAIRRYVEWALGSRPRYRQRLLHLPGVDRYLWRDDDGFSLDYHIRHTALPRPGNERLLKRLAGRIFSQRLERSRPPWELWVVEGLEGDRFAIIFKIHHAMVDGIGGVDLMQALLRGTPDASIPTAKPWRARHPSSARELLRAELELRMAAPAAVARAARTALASPGESLRRAAHVARGIGKTLKNAAVPAVATSINPRELGPYRRFDWVEMDLDEVKEIKNRLGGTVNDVVLAIASGALADYLSLRGDRVDTLTDFRALLPVNVRPRSRATSMGNFISQVIARLPLAEPDPRARLDAIRAATNLLKSDGSEIHAAEFFEHLSDATGTALVSDILKIATFLRAFNVVITNVPGPPFPLYLLGAKLERLFPLVPLFDHQGVGIALVSYNGALCWGFNGDWQITGDLHELVEASMRQLGDYSRLAAGKREQEEWRPRQSANRL